MTLFFATLVKPVWTRRITAVMLLILAISGVILILYTTEVGPWAYSDSAAYLVTAQNIQMGRGIVLQNPNGVYELIPLHPPLYPLAVSLPMVFGANALQSTRWLNAILFGLTIFFAGWSTYTFTRSFWLAGGTGGLLLLGYGPVRGFSGAMSEGLFIFLSLCSLFLLAWVVSRHKPSYWFFMLAGSLAGLAILARYIGLALLATGAFIILVCGSSVIKTRFRQLFAFLTTGVAVPLVWLVPVYLSTGTFGDRQVGSLTNILPKARQYFQSFMDVAGGWLPYFNRGNHIISPTWKLILAGLIIVGLITATFVVLRRNKLPLNENGMLTWGINLMVFCAAYIAVHLATYISALTQPDVDNRLLLPVYITLALISAVIVAFISRLVKPQWLGGIGFVIMALVTVWYFHGTLQHFLFEMNHYGEGYTSKRWNENPIFEQVRALPESQPLNSNIPGLVLFYTGHFPWTIVEGTAVKTYTLDFPADQGLVLFKLEGDLTLGTRLDDYVKSARNRFQVVYEDNEGILFLPR